MTREEARQAAEILTAYADGKTIQVNQLADGSGLWTNVIDEDGPRFDFWNTAYRIKPEPREWMLNPENGCGLSLRNYQLASAQENLNHYVKVREVMSDE